MHVNTRHLHTLGLDATLNGGYISHHGKGNWHLIYFACVSITNDDDPVMLVFTPSN